MKKKLIASFLLIVSFWIFPLTISIAANEEPSEFWGNLLWNIESYNYYVDSSANTYLTPIANAAYNWVYTGYGYNRLYPNTRTTNISNSAVDIYAYDQGDLGNARTFFFARTNGSYGTAFEVNPDQHNWLYNEIKINNYYMSNKTANHRQGVIAHEFGHCFGLDENYFNQYSIMCQTSSGRAVYTVQQVDNNAFNRKHP